MLLCEYILNSTRSPPSEEVLYHTLLQLYLAEDAPEETESEEAVPSTSQAARRYGVHGWDIPIGSRNSIYPDTLSPNNPQEHSPQPAS